MAWECRKNTNAVEATKVKKPSDDVTRPSRRGYWGNRGKREQLPAEELPIDGPLKFKRSA